MAIQNPGKAFEKAWRDSVKKRNYYYLRLKDSMSSFCNATNIKFTPNNPYDCVMFAEGTMYCFELKSTKATGLTFWSEKIGRTNPRAAEESMIKKHQVEGLEEASKHEGIVAGLVINFRETSNRTYFWNIKHFLKFAQNTTKKSFNENDVINNSGICIPQTLKRITYDYEIENLVDMFGNCKVINKR